MRVNATIPDDLGKQLRDAAKAQKRSVSNFLALLIAEALRPRGGAK